MALSAAGVTVILNGVGGDSRETSSRLALRPGWDGVSGGMLCAGWEGVSGGVLVVGDTTLMGKSFLDTLVGLESSLC